MKTFYKTAMAVVAAMTLTLTSCGDDDSNSTNNNLPSGTYISAKVDGSNFETLTIAGHSTAVAQKVTTGDQTLVSISASSPNTNTMVITLMGITGTGTYNLNETDNNNFNASFVDFGTNISYNSTADCQGAGGTLEVTHYDNQKIEGVFHFVGKNDDNCSDSKNITDGSFRGVFQN